MQTWRLIPARSKGRGEVIARHQSLKPYWGKPTVRNFRGGAGNVRDGRTRTPLHTSKEWRAETLGLRLRAPVLYSTGQSAQALWEKIPARYQEHAVFYTDHYAAYPGVILSAQHRAISKLARKTNHVERLNCTLRQRVSRLVRATLSFSKKLSNHIGAIKYFICDYNLTKCAALPE